MVVIYRRRAEAAPDSPEAQYLAAQAYFEAGLFDNARASFLRVREYGLPNLDRDLGRTLFRLRQDDAALSVLRGAVEADPKDALAHYELGRVLEAKGDQKAAMHSYERAVELAPTLEEAQYALGSLAGRRGAAGKGYYHLGMAFYLNGELEKALSQFERAAPLFEGEGPRAEELRANVEDLRELLDKGK
jgi:tetratricopeptide (TPR) repeat protein